MAAALLAVDAAAADRRRKVRERNADVTVRPMADGMAELGLFTSVPVAVACRETVDELARMLKAGGDARSIGVLRALVMADLILRPWDTSRPSVTAHLQLIAPLPAVGGAGGTEDYGVPTDGDTATVDGAPITAGQLRELLAQLDALCPGGLQPPTGGSLGIHLTDPVTGALRATVTRPELERLARRGCPQHPTATSRRPRRRPHPAAAEAADSTGAGAAVPDERGQPSGDCGCAVLEAPPPVDRYAPTPAQHRHVKARDRTCRHPGCRRPAAWTDRDHVVARSAGGETSCENLCCLCRRHHRLKTHARGWRFTMTADGVLSVTTPCGVTRTTRPPGLRLPADLLLVGGDPPALTDDDPPPF